MLQKCKQVKWSYISINFKWNFYLIKVSISFVSYNFCQQFQKSRPWYNLFHLHMLQTGPRAFRVAFAKDMFPLEQTWSIVTSRIHGEYQSIVSSGTFKLPKHTGFYRFKVADGNRVVSISRSIYLIKAGTCDKVELSREAVLEPAISIRGEIIL